MSEEKKIFLKTGQSQISITGLLIEELKPSMEYLTYNIRRYHVPITLVLFYSEEDISKHLTATKRLTDEIHTIRRGDSYFNFVFLLFTDEEDCYAFIKHIEHSVLKKTENFHYCEQLPPTIHNYYNFINNYLFEIAQMEETIVTNYSYP